MEHVKVEGSSNIASYGYDARVKVLEVRFISGALWRYPEVTQAEYDGLKAAESKGRYIARAIIGGRKGAHKVE